MDVISVAIPSSLLKKLDSIMKERGYTSRSEAIRDAIRSYIMEYEALTLMRGTASAVLTMIYEVGAVKSEEISMVEHTYENILKGIVHMHINRNCFEVLVASGDVEKVRRLVNDLSVLKGVKAVKITLASEI